MAVPNHFKLDFIREEQHLMLPTITSIKLTQNLYDVLFQYVITEEREELLKKFIGMMEDHIKRKDQAPFSTPIADLEFLDEGLEELRLLNWIEIPVAIFQVTLDPDIKDEDQAEELEKITTWLEGLMVFSWSADSRQIRVYPYTLVR
ncbi:MAG: hypothetical protein VB084_00900 [Syntrophomonadaceae bacterium]|nr:hypothetical protein [Syntrophomonadaceae bacterium]